MTDPCPRCARPIADTGYVCHHCATRLAGDLLQAGLLTGELEVTIARLDVMGEPDETRLAVASSAEKSLPFDWDASDAAWAIHNTLTSWARHIATRRGLAPPADRTTVVAAWVARHVMWLRVRPEAEDAFDELSYAARLLIRTVDTHSPRWYAGPCGIPTDDGLCDVELYVPAGRDTVRCHGCGTEHDTAARKVWLVAQAENTLAHAELVARALTALDWPVTPASVRGYAHRGRLVAHGHDPAGRPLYRVGDVLYLLRQAARRGELLDKGQPANA